MSTSQVTQKPSNISSRVCKTVGAVNTSDAVGSFLRYTSTVVGPRLSHVETSYQRRLY